ncbi:anthranilate synthase component II [Aliikangiella coralliicola]|uniref:Aminodeoxychorismate/anthranilate synthase component II n=1 Tax=Aliikangiella coralliicola TaxID=2592383 RepID=A0A545UGU3_9GAMM|nr:aminodeoxychorismate/anthranilate synthase component II [Aliikangiella coralliicola]TQV88698.1 aminodeoxychorismate/anthranilate synthase component II [Aliikangiella coralliicola]
MIDNYDSFTFNLVHYLQQITAEINDDEEQQQKSEVVVKRNDQLTLADIERLAPSHIVISPGPCDPDKAGLSLDIVNHFKGVIPILGICLGHQVIGQCFGGKVVKAETVVHGKTSKIYHVNQGIFTGLPQGFTATRYHSLVLEKESLPDCLQVTAWTNFNSDENQDDRQNDIEYIMGIKHREFPIEGVQFHPESVLSQHGVEMLRVFVHNS